MDEITCGTHDCSIFSPSNLFLFVRSVVADACVSMDEWVQHPTAHTALDDVLPCVDNATAQETSSRTKDVTYKLSSMVDKVINNISNLNNPPPQLGPIYFNQSGPLLPALCNPYNADLTDRKCALGEVELQNATQVLLLKYALFSIYRTSNVYVSIISSNVLNFVLSRCGRVMCVRLIRQASV